MTPNELFQAALQLRGTPWRVVRSDFSGEPPTLEIGLDFARGSRFPCPQCGELCGAYDTVQKRWRHLNFFQYRCELVAAVPRLRFAGLWEDLSNDEWLHTCTRSLANRISLCERSTPRCQKHQEAWLSGEAGKEILVPFPADRMKAWPISARINAPRNDDPEIIVPIKVESAARADGLVDRLIYAARNFPELGWLEILPPEPGKEVRETDIVHESLEMPLIDPEDRGVSS